ncbi:MAG: ribbon-helix-helix protein, CopG family [Betaproteobacteria bacterium]|nr:ribbon-helix-helix protein, CopG family [Betaproteobacteria bacterium]
MTTTSIQLDPATERRLDRLAAQTGRTKAYLLRALIASGLDDLEDFYRAAAILERARNGEETIHSADQVRAELGLDK